jgi:hypothetical protein
VAEDMKPGTGNRDRAEFGKRGSARAGPRGAPHTGLRGPLSAGIKGDRTAQGPVQRREVQSGIATFRRDR